MRGAAPAAARLAVERSDEYLRIGGAHRRLIVESGSIVSFVLVSFSY